MAKKLPRYPIPVALLGRLAVDKFFQGKGLGSILLAEACQKVAQASAVLAVAGIMVDAKDQIAVSFYQHFGFKPLPENAKRLFLPVNPIRCAERREAIIYKQKPPSANQWRFFVVYTIAIAICATIFIKCSTPEKHHAATQHSPNAQPVRKT